MAGNGKFLYAQVEEEAHELMDEIRGIFPDALKHFAGEFRRLNEIITELVIIVGSIDQQIALIRWLHLTFYRMLALTEPYIRRIKKWPAG
jgi:DNA polymerase (family 10)